MILPGEAIKHLLGLQHVRALSERDPAYNYAGIIDCCVQAMRAGVTERQRFIFEAAIIFCELESACPTDKQLKFMKLIESFSDVAMAVWYDDNLPQDEAGDAVLFLLEDCICAAAMLVGHPGLWRKQFETFDRWRAYLQPPHD